MTIRILAISTNVNASIRTDFEADWYIHRFHTLIRNWTKSLFQWRHQTAKPRTECRHYQWRYCLPASAPNRQHSTHQSSPPHLGRGWGWGFPASSLKFKHPASGFQLIAYAGSKESSPWVKQLCSI